MFDILIYLFETYYQPGAYPAPAVLARKLFAAGFEKEEISAALEWLSGLEVLAGEEGCRAAGRSVRLYCAIEIVKLPTECRGFLGFLENSGAIDSMLREMIIERAMALPEPVVSFGKLKIIVLMVMWQRQHALDTLLLEELLSEDSDLPLAH